jgi:hypothetical protein
VYPKKLSKEQEQLKKLKAFSNAEKEKSSMEEETDDQVCKRNRVLVQLNIVPVLCHLCKNASDQVLQCVGTIFLNISIDKDLRGKVAQQGFSVLKSMSKNEIQSASHALAKVLITTDPALIFKGDSFLDCVSPLIQLCRSEDGLCQFEALLALTNLASIDSQSRSKIVQASSLSLFESLVLSDHTLIRRAATELLCNLMFEESVFEAYIHPGNSSRLKLMVALSDASDYETRRAASGILAILSSSTTGCESMMKESRFFEIVKGLMLDSEPEIYHRGIECAKNCCLHFESVKSKIVTEDVLKKLLMATRLENAAIRECSLEFLHHLKN